MKRFTLTALVFLAPSLVWADGYYNPGVDCIPGVAGGGDVLVDAGASLCVQRPTDDTAPADLSIRPASAWPFGTQDPANLILAGGMDEKSITIGDYTIAAADEVEITVNGVVVATLIEGTHFDCIISNDVCATALALAIEAVSGTSASAVAAKVGIDPDQCGTWGLSTAIADGAADGAFATSDNGTDGALVVRGDLHFPNTSKIFLGTTSADVMIKYGGSGSFAVRLRSGDDTVDAALRCATIGSSGWVYVPLNKGFYFDLGTTWYGPVDGETYFTNYAANDLTKFGFGPQTAPYPALYPDGAGGVTLAGGDAVTDVMALDVTGNLTALKVNSDTHVFAGADYRVGFASRTLLESKETGDLLLMNYAMTGFDSLQLGPAMTTDADPSNPSILGANSWARATGSNRNGGVEHLAGGVQTMQIVCSAFALGDQDEIEFEIDGAVTTLVESTDFDCEGTSDDQCCINIDAALPAALTGDSTTTAGTVYITPDADVKFVGPILITDGAANGVFGSVVEGTPGGVKLWGDVAVPSYNVAYVITGGTANLGPTAPGHQENDSCAGLAFDADAQSVHLSFEIPSCYADGADDDLVLKIYWCGEDSQNPTQGEVIKFDIEYRSLDWGTDDVDFEAAITDSMTYTEAADPGDEGATHLDVIVLDADAATQALDVGDSLEIRFDRDWGVGSNYPHDAIIPKFEIVVPQTSLICDHHN